MIKITLKNETGYAGETNSYEITIAGDINPTEFTTLNNAIKIITNLMDPKVEAEKKQYDKDRE